ncbi:MAG: hypothetical protein HYT16_03745 [DPANN group archaeon]|nr:hypothetical protein [DPANN group archaeon]
MLQPKVLVSAPISEKYMYCFDAFVNGLKAIDYQNFEIILIADDVPKENKIKEKTEMLLNRLKNEGFTVVFIPWFEKARDRICGSHNKMREIVLEKDFGYLLTLDMDTIPPPDVIKKLLSHKKGVVSGLYFGQHEIDGQLMQVPFAWVFKSRENFWGRLRYLMPNEFSSGKLIELGMAGTGCVLVSKKILEKIKFHYDSGIDAADDRWFFYDCHRLGVQPYIDTDVICMHHWQARPFDWSQIKKEGKF